MGERGGLWEFPNELNEETKNNAFQKLFLCTWWEMCAVQNERMNNEWIVWRKWEQTQK